MTLKHYLFWWIEICCEFSINKGRIGAQVEGHLLENGLGWTSRHHNAQVRSGRYWRQWEQTKSCRRWFPTRKFIVRPEPFALNLNILNISKAFNFHHSAVLSNRFNSFFIFQIHSYFSLFYPFIPNFFNTSILIWFSNPFISSISIIFDHYFGLSFGWQPNFEGT